MRKSMKKVIVAFTAAVLVSAIILSTLYVIGEIGHSCSKDHCPVCSTVEISLYILSGSTSIGAISAASITAAFAFIRKLEGKRLLLVKPTLTSFMIRIDC